MYNRTLFRPLSFFSFLLSVSFFLLIITPQRSVRAANVPGVPLQELKKIQKFYNDLSSLSFDFRQLTRSNGRQRTGAGNSVFYRASSGLPGIMRWDYSKPDTQIILNDGNELSIYTKKDKQLIIMSARKLQSDLTYAFFSGKRNLLDDFTPLSPDSRFMGSPTDRNLLAVKLVPKKPDGQTKAIHLWFDQQFLIRKLILEDHFETITELTFSNIRFNALPKNSPQTMAKLVQLNLPSDTEIIRQ